MAEVLIIIAYIQKILQQLTAVVTHTKRCGVVTRK